MCVTMYVGGSGGWTLVVGGVRGIGGARVLEAMRSVVPCMLEAVEGELCLLCWPAATRRVRTRPEQEFVVGGLGRVRDDERMEELDVMRCMMLCMLEAVDGGLWFAESVGVGGAARAAGAGGAGRAGGDALCATLYAGGCGRLAQFRCFEISIAAVFSPSARTGRLDIKASSTLLCVCIVPQLLHSTSFPGKSPRCNV